MLSIQYAVFSFCPFFYYSFYVRGICEKRIVCAIVANGFVYVWQQPQSPNEHTHTRNTHTIYQAMWNLWSVKDNAHYLFKLISPGSRTRAHRANRRFPYSFVHLLVFLFFFLSCHPFFSVISATQWMHLSVIWLSLFLSAFFVVVFFFLLPRLVYNFCLHTEFNGSSLLCIHFSQHFHAGCIPTIYRFCSLNLTQCIFCFTTRNLNGDVSHTHKKRLK